MKRSPLYAVLSVIGFGWLALVGVFFVAPHWTDAFSNPFSLWLLRVVNDQRSWAFYIFNPDAPWGWIVDILVFLPTIIALGWRENLRRSN